MWVKYDSANSNILIEISDNEFQDLIHNQVQVEYNGDWEPPQAGLFFVPHVWRYNETESEVEVNTLNNIIPYRVALKPDQNYRLYKYLFKDHATLVEKLHEPPFGFDYTINVDPKMKKTTQVFNADGFLTSVIWSIYDFDLGQPIEEVLKVDIVYDLNEDATLQAAKTVIGRTTTRQWILEDGTYKADLSDVSTRKKTYDTHLERKQQGQTRRKNIASFTEEAFVTLVTILHTAGDQQAAEDIGKVLLGTYQADFNNYIEVGHDALITSIENHVGAPAEAALEVVVPDTAPVNVLYPTAVGQTIRAYIADRYRGVAI